MSDNTIEIQAALRNFGQAVEGLLLAWLAQLPPEGVRVLDAAVAAGAQVGIKVMIAAPGRAPTLELLATDPAGEVFVIGVLAHTQGPMQ